MNGGERVEHGLRFESPLLAVDRKDIVASSVQALTSDDHVVMLRKLVRERALEMKLSLVDQTKIVTAASELARNTIKYGGGGVALVHKLVDGPRQGMQLVFGDDGPGIADLGLALTDGYTTGGGLGLGLSGSKRLVDQFELDSRVGQGTVVCITKWKR
jgi:serine/threonine-protein kinase RsbT